MQRVSSGSRVRLPDRAKSRRTRKLAVLALCLAGFLYQTVSFLALYFNYPTVMDVQVKMPDHVPVPAITYCDINLISNYKYCQDKNNSCHFFNTKKLSQRYPTGKKFLRTFAGILVAYSDVKRLFQLPQAEIMKYIQAKYILEDDVVKGIKVYVDNDMDRTLNITYVRVAPSVRSALQNPPICFYFNVFENTSAEEWATMPVGNTISTVLSLTTHTHVFGPEYGAAQISLHTPYSHANPFVDGLEAKEGMSYFFDFSLVVKKRLPKPYETDCFDYLAKRREEGSTGPTNQKECVEECKMRQSNSELECVLNSIWYPHSFRRCEPANERKLLALYTSICEGKCKQACTEYIMETTKHEFIPAEKIVCEGPDQALRNSLPTQTFIVVRFSPAVETIYETLPKYQLTEVFSNVGGFIGMWMGVSLMALYNMFEVVLVFFWKSFAARNFSKVQPY